MTAAPTSGPGTSGFEALFAAVLASPDRAFGIAVNRIRLLVLKYPEDIAHVLIENRAAYSKETTPNLFFREHVADGLLTAPEHRWRPEHTMLAAALRDTERVERVATRHAERIADELSARARAGDHVDLTATMSRLTLAITVDALFGWELDENLAETTRAAMETLDATGTMLPTPELLAADGVHARLKQAVTDRLTHQSPISRGPALRAMADRNLPFDQTVQQTLTLLLSGHETTASSLAWTWIELCRNPTHYTHWQQRLHDHPDTARAAGRAIFEEVLRLWPAGWVFGRRAESDDTIAGHRVPAGTDVMISPYLTHRLPTLWPDPETFTPHRPHPTRRFAYFPFGGGHRVCLGQPFSLREAEIILTTLGRRFRFESEAAATATPQFQYTLRAPSLQTKITEL